MRLAIFSVAAVFGALVSAAPFRIERRDVSDDVLSKLQLFSQYAGAAYCMGNNDSPGTPVTCASGNCPLVEAAGAKTTKEFQNTLFTDTTGFVAVDDTNKLIVVSFRGTTSVRGAIADGEALQEASDICDGCTAHSGFYSAWKEVRDLITSAVKDAAGTNPDYTVISTGHSLGAAIASIAVAELRNSGQPAFLYNYGSPRIGNDALSQFITNQGNNYRVTHSDDPVPKLPPTFLGYTHISPEYWIENAQDDVAATDIQVLEGTTENVGNAGTGGFDILAHGVYFGNIAACSPGFTFT